MEVVRFLSARRLFFYDVGHLGVIDLFSVLALLLCGAALVETGAELLDVLSATRVLFLLRRRVLLLAGGKAGLTDRSFHVAVVSVPLPTVLRRRL